MRNDQSVDSRSPLEEKISAIGLHHPGRCGAGFKVRGGPVNAPEERAGLVAIATTRQRFPEDG